MTVQGVGDNTAEKNPSILHRGQVRQGFRFKGAIGN